MTLASTNFSHAAGTRVSCPSGVYGAPTVLPGSYPAFVPQPYGYTPVPIQPADDYYISKRELLRILSEQGLGDVVYKKPDVTEGNLAVFSGDGDLVDSKTSLSVMRTTISQNTESVSKILEILTSRDNLARQQADDLMQMMDGKDLKSMTQGEETEFLIQIMKYVIAREGMEIER
jgi:hypothetical protein